MSIVSRWPRVLAASLFAMAGLITLPSARADQGVSYEIVSGDITTANVEFYDRSERKAVTGVRLPWRIDVTVPNPSSSWIDGAQVRADWRPSARPGKWVTVRIYSSGKVICQSTLDIGDATCYGNTAYIS